MPVDLAGVAQHPCWRQLENRRLAPASFVRTPLVGVPASRYLN